MHRVVCCWVRNFGEDVLDYAEVRGTSLPMQDRLALFKCSQVLVLTAVREVRFTNMGVPHEIIAVEGKVTIP